MADQPDEPKHLKDLPLPSMTPSSEPPTLTPKSKAQKQREYRQRLAASRTPAQVMAARKSETERKRNHRLRKAPNSAIVSSSLESTTASSLSNDVETGTQRQLAHDQRQTSAAEPVQINVQPDTSAQITVQPSTSDPIGVQKAQSTWNTKWASAIMRFKLTFLDNDFGHACSVCDRLWFKNDLKPISEPQLEVISKWSIKENRRLRREEYAMVCSGCKRSLNKKSMPPLAKVNGFSFPDRPLGLPPLDPTSERLISPRLPFMQLHRLRHISYGIQRQVINVPLDVQEMVKSLPRQLNEDDVIYVDIKRNLAHKSKSSMSAWLTLLQKSSLYRLYEINVDLSKLQTPEPCLDDIQDDPSNHIEDISAENTPDEILASIQHVMMWNEEDCLSIALRQQEIPLNIMDDRHAEELSFPSIYFGEPRRFKMGVSVTPHMMATSEIRRRDRRGATPQKVLYVAMKILRLRMVDGINSTFCNVPVAENVPRRVLEDTEFRKEGVIQNLAFMKTVPNSVQYWASRKRDLFALIRQLGKPTVLLTISANETRWMKLLTILLKLSKKYPGKTAEDLDTSERFTLVSDDPVTCCIYFYRLVGILMKMLKSKQSYNPFGKYFVKDYFLRIEFQHLESPGAHILLWLNDDPRETVSEDMPKTIDLVETLISVAQDHVPHSSIYANQTHKHTLTCTKRGETICRFGIPYWPMPTSRVLIPILQSDGRLQTLQQKAKELRTSLGEHRYACMDDFLNANGLTFVSYLDIVRSTMRRPTLVFRRNFDELMTNPFNPYLVGEVNSNIDIQFILDDYSCAEYVVEYVNKSARGMDNLLREITTMMQERPDHDRTSQLKALSTKLLNAVQISAQEAAWYLLRQPTSETSRQVVYIPTVWPTERKRCRKRRQQVDREGIDGDSTDVWTKNIIQRYEERPASLEQVYLAEFASWYANANDFVDEEHDFARAL
ncbi:jg13533 [Pararge aegeria aegeria]|uniref:Jg13533 protein n=1 Tax=Pararge aegeria aegeria TaxID=348720 RepID=A0A8S4QWM9_9NEOP|nr:jg13533 [Pararge aegeria aegeria]